MFSIILRVVSLPWRSSTAFTFSYGFPPCVLSEQSEHKIYSWLCLHQTRNVIFFHSLIESTPLVISYRSYNLTFTLDLIMGNKYRRLKNKSATIAIKRKVKAPPSAHFNNEGANNLHCDTNEHQDHQPITNLL